jgi:hypothetical protein
MTNERVGPALLAAGLHDEAIRTLAVEVHGAKERENDQERDADEECRAGSARGPHE